MLFSSLVYGCNSGRHNFHSSSTPRCNVTQKSKSVLPCPSALSGIAHHLSHPHRRLRLLQNLIIPRRLLGLPLYKNLHQVLWLTRYYALCLRLAIIDQPRLPVQEIWKPTMLRIMHTYARKVDVAQCSPMRVCWSW